MGFLLYDVGWCALVGLTYLMSQYTDIVQRVDLAFQDYGGTCAHEHSLYDVEAAHRSLRIMRRGYFVLVTLISAVCFSH